MENHRCYCDHPGHCQWHHSVTDKESFIKCQRGTPPGRPSVQPCVYLAEHMRDEFYRCNLFGECTIGQNEVAKPSCSDCKEHLEWDSSELVEQFQDPLIVTDRNQRPIQAHRGLLAGTPVFLVCGGPSAREVPFQRLSERGIFSLGVNNIAGCVPVSAFVCSDPPMKFHWGIFCDPKIMKFIPTPKLGRSKGRGKLRRKEGDSFTWMDLNARDCPNVWGFEKRNWILPDHTFFTHPGATLGNLDCGVQKTGDHKTASTMLQGIRVLYYLGARTIFLLGCDFYMKPSADLKENYAFAEDRDSGAIKSNNRQYRVAAGWLGKLRPVFEQFGLYVYNTNPNSHLRAFDHVPFDQALETCRGLVPLEPFDLGGHYAKKTKE